MDLDRWKDQRVRLKRTISAQVMISKNLVTETDEWGSKNRRLVNLFKGEVFTVIGHHKGKLDLLYRPLKMSEKIILHVPPSVLETHTNGHPIH